MVVKIIPTADENGYYKMKVPFPTKEEYTDGGWTDLEFQVNENVTAHVELQDTTS